MNVELTKEIRFEAAHRLPRVPEGHKCGRMHGHSYRVVLALAGPVEPDAGWLMDFGDIEAAFAPLRERLDHRVLNEIPGLENPTVEHLAAWLWGELHDGLPQLRAVTVWETPGSSVTYRGTEQEEQQTHQGGQERKQIANQIDELSHGSGFSV